MSANSPSKIDLIKRKPRQPWGWGPEGDQEDPFTRLAKRAATEAKETVSDLKDEPDEALYRLRIRLRDLLRGRDR